MPVEIDWVKLATTLAGLFLLILGFAAGRMARGDRHTIEYIDEQLERSEADSERG